MTCRDSEPQRGPSEPAEPAVEPVGQAATTAADPLDSFAAPGPLDNAAKQDLETLQDTVDEVPRLDQAELGSDSTKPAVSGQLDKVDSPAAEPMSS